jgi:N-acetylneuraminic acid mutarotase
MIKPAGFVIDGKIYIGLGQTDIITSNIYEYNSKFWVYDPLLDLWDPIADFPGVARSGAVGFSLDGKGFVGMGSNISHGKFKDFWTYDPMLNNWRRIADLPSSPRDGAVSAMVNDRIFVGLGSEENDFWEFK